MRPQSAQAHLLVVAQKHGHIGRSHDLPEDVHSQGAPVNDVPQDVQMVLIREANQFQHLLKLVQFAVYIRHTVNHRPHLLTERM